MIYNTLSSEKIAGQFQNTIDVLSSPNTNTNSKAKCKLERMGIIEKNSKLTLTPNAVALLSIMKKDATAPQKPGNYGPEKTAAQILHLNSI